MSNNNNVLPIAIIGLIVVAITLAGFFLLEIAHILINIWALSFLLLSELVLFAGLMILRISNAPYNTIFLKAGVTSALILYFAATFVTALLAGMFVDRLHVYILIKLCIIAFFTIIAIVLVSFAKKITYSNMTDAPKVESHEPKRGGF